jgi:hypothetical protein
MKTPICGSKFVGLRGDRRKACSADWKMESVEALSRRMERVPGGSVVDRVRRRGMAVGGMGMP